MITPLAFSEEPTDLPEDKSDRHEQLADLFGKFILWERNRSFDIVCNFVESDEDRNKLGKIRREPYEGVSHLSAADREAMFAFTQEAIDCFIERLLWAFGDEGTDARYGNRHAYRFLLQMEIVDIESCDVVATETINRGGKFFGSYWGRWLNRFGKQQM